ncbi:hypothetical protein AOQ84DRAFT_218213 [Glonium stellatum]|uniref:NB-ARC domain-containing protein n=1 Tax=Glonium stellatum TaxID=574774 RepID=A0A8E2EMS2_9PEZI|nr:hypothetical protein AOQ84DRAFT_218213 [Glonium stellatum]
MDPIRTPMTPPVRVTDAAIHLEGSQFSEARVSGGVLVQGNVVGLTINSNAASQADHVGCYSRVFLHPVKTFVRRPELCEQIRRQLHDRPGSDTAGGSGEYGKKVLAVWGLGGTGKTQLVLDYLQRYRNEYKAAFWIEAERKASVERDLINIYKLLFPARLSAGQETVKIDDAVVAVKNWFSNGQDRWLMVFDGADSIDNENDAEFLDLAYYMPESPAVHVIVTTRSRTAKDMTMLEGVNVGEMDEQQAVDLFYESSRPMKRDNKTEEEVGCIVKELGYLALAINLAGTYVSRTPRLLFDIRGYLPEYRRRRQELLGRKPEKLVHQYGKSVLTTWETSYQAIKQQSAGAAKLLTFLAFLNFDDIYLELFGMSIEPQGAEPSDHPNEHLSWRTMLSPGTDMDIYELEKYFDVLQLYSFVQRKSDQRSYSMHKLVHAWGYDRLQSEEQRDPSLGALQLVYEAATDPKAGPYGKLRLLPHIMANFDAVAKSMSRLEMIEHVLVPLEVLGRFAHDIGRLPEAYLMKAFVVEEHCALHGDEHLETLRAMDTLANTLADQGKNSEAAAIMTEVLEKRRRILGEEHLNTIAAMHHLAVILDKQGKHNKAAAMQIEVLEKRRRILGEEHLGTITARHVLANTLYMQGKRNEASAIITEVLEKRRRVLGEEHLSTIATIYNLANVLGC